MKRYKLCLSNPSKEWISSDLCVPMQSIVEKCCRSCNHENNNFYAHDVCISYITYECRSIKGFFCNRNTYQASSVKNICCLLESYSYNPKTNLRYSSTSLNVGDSHEALLVATSFSSLFRVCCSSSVKAAKNCFAASIDAYSACWSRCLPASKR